MSDPQTEGQRQAANARRTAERRLNEVRSWWDTVRDFSDTLSKIREDDKFAAEILGAFKL